VSPHIYVTREGERLKCFCLAGVDHDQVGFGKAPEPDPQS